MLFNCESFNSTLLTVTAYAILPLTPTPEQSFFRSLLDLSLPFMVRAAIGVSHETPPLTKHSSVTYCYSI